MYVKVSVTPGAKKEKVALATSDHFLISVKEPAERNLANKRVVHVIAEHFNVPAHQVRVVSGHRSPRKVLSVETGAV